MANERKAQPASIARPLSRTNAAEAYATVSADIDEALRRIRTHLAERHAEVGANPRWDEIGSRAYVRSELADIAAFLGEASDEEREYFNL